MGKSSKPAKLNIAMCIACVLLCLTLVSIRLSGGLYAKYTTSAAAADSARVIRFGELALTESGDFGIDGKWMIIPGVNLTKRAVVDFEGSEAATYVFAEVLPSSHWEAADNMTFSIQNGGKVLMQFGIADGWEFLKRHTNGAFIYYQELAPNTALAADIIAENGNITVSDGITKYEISGFSGVSVKLRAAAVQSGGFESPAAAWESLVKQ